MIPFAWDTETFRFGPGLQAPPLVCMSYCHAGGSGLVGYKEAEALFEELIYDDEYLLIGHNIAYDLAVIAAQYPRFLRPIFEAYEKGRITDTLVRQKLLDISIGHFRGYHKVKSAKEQKKGSASQTYWVGYSYTLDDCYYRATRRRLDKDTWRTRYGELRDTPVEEWPEGAREYARMDAEATWDVYQWQKESEVRIRQKFGVLKTHVKEAKPLDDEFRQAKAAWWLHLTKVHGIRTNPRNLSELQQEIDKHYRRLEDLLKLEGLVKPDGVRNVKAAQARMVAAMGGIDNCRLTDKGNVKLDEEACIASGDPALMDYAELGSLKVVRSKDVPALMKGVIMPIHSNFNSLVGTGRTSSSNPNIQNIRRLEGIRECFVPRKGKVFLDADYDGLELRTLAQVCLKLVGRSRLADVLNSGKDAHTAVAAEILGVSYEEAVRRVDAQEKAAEDARQLAKALNFGLPGGLGKETFIYFARKQYGIKIKESEFLSLKKKWMKAYPEMEDYFYLIGKHMSENPHSSLGFVQHIFTNRIRGGVGYTVACNSYFQGLGGDATKEAGFRIAKACYLEEESPLYGCRIVNFIHDQFLVECDEDKAHEAVMELVRLMVEGASVYLPDVPPTVSKPVVARRWSKKAKQVWADGKLVPWDVDYQVKVRQSRKKVA